MKDQCAICYGVIRMIGVGGAYHLEELATRLGRIFRKLSITTTG